MVLLPEAYRFFDVGVRLHDPLPQSIGIVGRDEGYGVFVVGLAHVVEGLHHEPRGVVGVFHGEVGLSVGERLQVDGLRSGSRLREGHRVGDVFAVGENRQVVLLSVACRLGVGDDARHVEVGLQGGNVECHHRRRLVLRSEVELAALLINYFVCGRIDDFQSCLTLCCLVGGVGDGGRELGGVSLADEAGQVGLHHQLLLRHGLALKQSVVHVLVVGQAHEAPCGHALGQTEGELHVALVVGKQGGVEEGRLVEVLAQAGHWLACRVFFGLGICRCRSCVRAYDYCFRQFGVSAKISKGSAFQLCHLHRSAGCRVVAVIHLIVP